MKIVIIRSNPVLPDPRVAKEACSLHDAGHGVSIVCWDRRSNVDTVEYLDVKSGIDVHRLGFKATFGEGLKNILPYLKFQVAMCKWLYTHRSKYDVIHACDFDTAFFAFHVSKLLHKRFVFDIFDFICGAPQNTFERFVYKSEINLINHADAVIICTEHRREQIGEAHPKRLVVIHNTPLQTLSISREFTDNIGGYGVLKIAYVGILQEHRMIKELLELVACNNTFELHIAGFGVLEDYVKDMAGRYENIIFYGKIDYKKTLIVESKCDVLVAVYDPSIENHRYAAPNKFYEALMLGKPIIMAKNTGVASVVETMHTGLTIDYLSNALETALLSVYRQRDVWNNRAKDLQGIYSKYYSWSIMRQRLLQLYVDLQEGK